MNRTIAFAVGMMLAMTVTPALAAPPMTALASWTGCYAGANAAYGWQGVSLSNIKEDPPEDMGSHTATGGAGGVQGGCDLQTGSLVFGLAGSFDWAAISGEHIGNPGEDPDRERSHASSFATLTGRVGYLPQPNFLLYAKGGAAWLRGTLDELYLNEGDAVLQVAPDNLVGWTVGAGTEWRFAPQWSLFAEYDYADFGKPQATYTDGKSWYTYGTTQSIGLALVGVNFRFGR